jgi:tetratricopeptide (TPR) repeat protein
MASEEPASARKALQGSEEERLVALLEEARAAASKGDLVAANESFALAADIERSLRAPSSPGVDEVSRRASLYTDWASVVASLGRPEQARWQSRKAIKGYLDWSGLLLERGDAEGALRRISDAAEVGERHGGMSDQDKFTAASLRGRALLVADRYREALEQLSEVAAWLRGQRADARLGEAHYLMGVARQGLRHYDDAIADFEEASRLATELATFAANAAFLVLWNRGKYEQAWSKLDLGFPSPSSSDVAHDMTGRATELYQIGLALFSRGELDEAHQYFEESKTLKSTNIPLWATLVEFYLERRDRDLEDPDRWYWRARDAFDQVRSLCESIPNHESDSSTRLKLGVLSTALGDFADAETHLQEVIDRGGDIPAASVNLGVISLRRGDLRKAVTRFDDAVRSNPDNPVIRRLLADSYVRLQLFDHAEDEYRAVLAKAPGDVESHIGLGEIALGRADGGDSDFYLEAIRVFDQALELDDERPSSDSPRLGALEPADARRCSLLTWICTREALRASDGLEECPAWSCRAASTSEERL